MALELVGFEVTFSIIGAFDGKRTKTVEFAPAGADVAAQRAQLDTDIGVWLDAFNDNNSFTGEFVSSAFVQGYTIANKYAETDNAPAFTGSENVYQEASIQARLNDKNELYSTYIPAPATQIFVGNSVNTRKIDTADSAYLTYAGLYVDGGICKISDGDSWESPLNVNDGELRTVRSGKSY